MQEPLALRLAVRPEPREAAVEVVLIARLREPAGCLRGGHHGAEGVLCESTVLLHCPPPCWNASSLPVCTARLHPAVTKPCSVWMLFNTIKFAVTSFIPSNRTLQTEKRVTTRLVLVLRFTSRKTSLNRQKRGYRLYFNDNELQGFPPAPSDSPPGAGLQLPACPAAHGSGSATARTARGSAGAVVHSAPPASPPPRPAPWRRRRRRRSRAAPAQRRGSLLFPAPRAAPPTLLCPLGPLDSPPPRSLFPRRRWPPSCPLSHATPSSSRESFPPVRAESGKGAARSDG